MKQLDKCGGLDAAASVLKLLEPATDRGLTIQVRIPPRARRRIQVGLHVGPSVALNFEHSCGYRSLEATPRRFVILLYTVRVGEFLAPWRDDAARLAVDETRDH